MEDNEVRALLKRLPPEHISNPPLCTVSYVDTVVVEEPSHRKYPAEHVLGQCDIAIGNGSADVQLFRQQEQGNIDVYQFKLSIYHEIGHVVFQYGLTEDQKQAWYALCVNKIVSWNPAGADPLEHFCDTYAFYSTDTLIVEKMFPLEYGFMIEQAFC